MQDGRLQARAARRVAKHERAARERREAAQALDALYEAFWTTVERALLPVATFLARGIVSAKRVLSR
jgi:hypothetical protein